MSYVLELDAAPVDRASAERLIATTAGPEFVSLVPARRRQPWDPRPRLWFDGRQANAVLDDHASLGQKRFTLSDRRGALARTVILLAAELESEWTLRSCWYGDKRRRAVQVTSYELADLIRGSVLRRDTAYRVAPASGPLESLSETFIALRSVEQTLPAFPVSDAVLKLSSPTAGVLRWRTCARWSADAAAYVRGPWTDGGCSLSCRATEDLLMQPLPHVGETTGPAFLPRPELLHLTAIAAREPIALRALAGILTTAHADPDPQSLAPAVDLAKAHDWPGLVAHLQSTNYLPPVLAEALLAC